MPESGHSELPPTVKEQLPASPSRLTPTVPGYPPSFSIPLTVAGYEILEELGRGGMGVVYKARQLGLNRIVALKVLLAGEHAGVDELARFRLEAETLARLQHPHIVQIYEVGEHEGRPFFSLEFIEGSSLARRLRGTPQPVQDAAALVEVLARAIQVAHERGIIHRDLKPANVLLSAADGLAEQAIPKITDFGLAKQLDSGTERTASGAVLGTPAYMAPEQAEGKSRTTGPAADIYSLGAILYELLTGRPPFKAATEMETLLQVLHEEPVSPRRLQPDCPRDLETVCLKCLSKEPHRRYQTALELAEDLRRFRAREPILARPAGPAERLLLWAQRRPMLAAVYGLLALVTVLGAAGAGVTWLWQRAERARTELAAEQEQTRAALEREHEAKSRAEADRTAAEDAHQREVQARKEAEKARQAESAAKERLDQVLYLRRVSLAQAEWRDNEVVRARDLLAECPPRRRCWEWYHIHHLCHAELLALAGHSNVVGRVVFSPDGQRLVGRHEQGLGRP
jgi:hypothetical protein